MNWRGRPLINHEPVVALIAATTTKTGLTVKAELDRNPYPRGIKISDDQLNAANPQGHEFHGEWNYNIHPKNTTTPT